MSQEQSLLFLPVTYVAIVTAMAGLEEMKSKLNVRYAKVPDGWMLILQLNGNHLNRVKYDHTKNHNQCRGF